MLLTLLILFKSQDVQMLQPHDCPTSRLNCKCFFADFQVRLNGSSLPFAGTINVLYYGVWGGILGFRIDIRAAHVVCRQLGYPGAKQVFKYPSFGRVVGPLWIRSIQCNGNETEISQCTMETWDKIWRSKSYFDYSWVYKRYQRPKYAACLLCNEGNSTVSKGRFGAAHIKSNFAG